MDPRQEPQRVSAAEFIRGFGSWRMQASRKPLVVTHHGKDAHVLISLADYRRLDGRGEAPADRLAASQAAIVESLRDAVIFVDRSARIAALNPAASDRLETPASALVGRELAEALPGFAGTMLHAHLLRMLHHRERFSGEVPGLIEPRRWMQVDLVPLAIGGAMVLRDTGDGWAALAEQDAYRALADAVEIDGRLGVARISVRERIEAANPALAALVGTDEAALRRVRFTALLPLGARQAFGEALETLFRTGAPTRLDSQLVTRDGDTLPVRLALVERRSAYASDGAVILVTKL